MRFTIAQLDRLKAEGKIRGYKVTEKKKVQDANGKLITKAFAKRSKEKEWIEQNLVYWCNAKCLELVQEYRFHPERKWCFDWCMPSVKIAIEYDGLFSEKSRHTTVNGFTGDANKLNAATSLGWRVIRLTALNYKSLLTELNRIIDGNNL